MLGITLKSVFTLSRTLLSSVVKNESRILHTLVNNSAANGGSARPCGPSQPTKSVCVCQCRDFHVTNIVPGKYHNLIKKRTKAKKKMAALRARLERLDKEDRPTGCILCPMRGDVQIDYKNVRLLSQFVSPHTGRIYGRAVTGLCRKKQVEVADAINRARNLGYMPITMKYFEFHNDPALF